MKILSSILVIFLLLVSVQLSNIKKSNGKKGCGKNPSSDYCVCKDGKFVPKSGDKYCKCDSNGFMMCY